MAIADAKRFADALSSDQELLAAAKPKVTGLAAFVEVGKQHGYNFNLDEAKQLIRSKVPPQQLSDQQLDAIAGGDSVKVATNVAAAVETLATAVTVTNGAAVSE